MHRRYAGFGEEAQHGTAVPAVATIDPESTSLDPAEDQALVFTGVSGFQRQVAAGPYSIEGDVTALLDDVVSGWFWKWLLGRYTTVGTAVGGGLNTTLSVAVAAGATQVTLAAVIGGAADDYVQVGTGDTAEVHKIQALAGNVLTLATPLRFNHEIGEAAVEVTAPYTHTFSPTTNPTLPPFTTRLGKDIFEHVFAGCVLSEAELAIEDSFAKLALSIMASKDAKGNLPAALTYTEGNVFAPHQVGVQLDSVDESARVEQLKLTVGNGAQLGRAVGSRFPNLGYRGEFTVSGELTFAFTDLQELERFWGGGTGPGSSLNEFPISIGIGANLDLVMPRTVYTHVGQPLEGPERIRQTAAFTALLDAGGDGPLQVVLVNNQPQYGG